MPAHRKDRRLRGSYQRTREPPSLVYLAPPPGELSEEQQKLLKLRPKRLLQAEKLEYRRCVILAPWLTEGDAELLVQWVQARSRYQVASKAFDKMLRLPGFAIPGSAVAKAAGPIGRLAHRETMVLLNLAARLGFSPQGRLALGVSTRKPPEKDENDPWHTLRLVRNPTDEGAA